MGNQCANGKNPKIKAPVTVAILGIDNAGKTVVAKGLKGETLEDVAPTVGFSTLQFKYQGQPVTMFDLGGGSKIRGIWKSYLAEVHAVIYVVDSADRERLDETAEVLQRLLHDRHVQRKPLLVLANKQDLDDAMAENELTQRLELNRLVDGSRTPCRLELSSAVKGTGRKLDKAIKDGLKWLMATIAREWDTLSERVADEKEAVEMQREQENREKRERVRLIREQREREEEEERRRQGLGPRRDSDDEDAEQERTLRETGGPFRRMDHDDLARKEREEKERKRKSRERAADDRGSDDGNVRSSWSRDKAARKPFSSGLGDKDRSWSRDRDRDLTRNSRDRDRDKDSDDGPTSRWSRGGGGGRSFLDPIETQSPVTSSRGKKKKRQFLKKHKHDDGASSQDELGRSSEGNGLNDTFRIEKGGARLGGGNVYDISELGGGGGQETRSSRDNYNSRDKYNTKRRYDDDDDDDKRRKNGRRYDDDDDEDEVLSSSRRRGGRGAGGDGGRAEAGKLRLGRRLDRDDDDDDDDDDVVKTPRKPRNWSPHASRESNRKSYGAQDSNSQDSGVEDEPYVTSSTRRRQQQQQQEGRSRTRPSPRLPPLDGRGEEEVAETAENNRRYKRGGVGGGLGKKNKIGHLDELGDSNYHGSAGGKAARLQRQDSNQFGNIHTKWALAEDLGDTEEYGGSRRSKGPNTDRYNIDY